MHRTLAFLACLFSALSVQSAAPLTNPYALRQQADKLQSSGKYNEALAINRTLALAPNLAGDAVVQALQKGVECLQQLNKIPECDAFIESASSAHPRDCLVLAFAANQYRRLPHNGYIVAGEFSRGWHRGGGRYVNVWERDRARSLQLFEQARLNGGNPDDTQKAACADILADYAEALQDSRMSARDSWRLQSKTDIAVLPPWEDSAPDTSRTSGAPVDETGVPVYHASPDSFATARTDGERIRWLQAEAIRLNPAIENRVLLARAAFLHYQFGVETLAEQMYLFRNDDSEGEPAKHLFDLESLGENETIARLATGIKRFSLPDDQNPLALLIKVGENKSAEGEEALTRLATLFSNRRQYEKSAQVLKLNIERYGNNKGKQRQLDQITGNWGTFEPLLPQSPVKPSFDFRFRNGRSVAFEARTIDVSRLLQDMKEYLKSNPRELDWNNLQLDNLGWRLIQTNQTRYIGEKAAEWSMDLTPRPRHFDKRITVQPPLTKPGAYWITSRMAQGNTTHLVLWIQDTILVEKPLTNSMLLYAADAESGAPVTNALVDLFGYKTVWKEEAGGKRGRNEVQTEQAASRTDLNGLVKGPVQNDGNLNWLYTATTTDGRFAFLGFASHWFGGRNQDRYEETRTYIITDRPVYRPGQAVQIKAWISPVRYDLPEASPYAGKPFTVRILDPRGEKVLETNLTADVYGGIASDMLLTKESTLGVYAIEIVNYGSSNFRVEEYKKPEFEVTVEAPTEPLALGDSFKALVKARYYFGAPVTKARVKWKVERRTYSVSWFPPGPWDWLYGRGYGWLAVDYDWYPGWQRWGCFRPFPWWQPTPYTQPEVIAENTVEIGADGTVAVPIDTALAKAVFGNMDHQYTITAEVTDESRRTIVGAGSVIASREPFKVYTWTTRGFYRAGDTVHASFNVRRPDGRPVSGRAKVRLLKLSYRSGAPVETAVQEWPVEIGETGDAELQLLAAQAGQYRLSVLVHSAAGQSVEGACLVTVRGEGFLSADYRFNALELIPDKAVYTPGEKVRLLLQADRADTTLLLFTRPVNGVYDEPEVIRLTGKSTLRELPVTTIDMPNFFVEAVAVHGGTVHTETREIRVPPEQRVLHVTVTPERETAKPGATNSVIVRATTLDGKPAAASMVLTVYDKAVDYISGGPNVPEIREFFWKWRRHHSPVSQTSADRHSAPVNPRGSPGMNNLGLFGDTVADEDKEASLNGFAGPVVMKGMRSGSAMAVGGAVDSLMPMAASAPMMADAKTKSEEFGSPVDAENPSEAPVAVRKAFADTAFWAAALTTDSNGEAKVRFPMPENLGEWTARGWAFALGARVGENTAKIVTTKNLLLRMQAPRFFVEKDEVVLSANIHNALNIEKRVRAVLELEGGTLQPVGKTENASLRVPPNGEVRVDWKVRAIKEGKALVRMKALSGDESDAVQMEFPVYVHGMLKTESWSGAIRQETNAAAIQITIPEERRPDQTKLEIRWSPTLAGAMVDALPYLAAYPYGCTEQTLNRFLPSVITRRVLERSGLKMEAIRAKRNNLNAQERGDPRTRAEGWKRFKDNPVFDTAELDQMVKTGVARLADMQGSDGGWNWFPGWQGESSPHLTAQIVHGLLVARACGVAVPEDALNRGTEWLRKFSAEQVRLLKESAAKKKDAWKEQADNMDALAYWTLVEAGADLPDLRDFLYRDRLQLSLYGQGLLGLALEKQGRKTELSMVLENIGEFVELDDENQTAWLRMNNGGYWWFWFGDEIEAHAIYLKLLSKTSPTDSRASRLVKYLLNNRKHATYWNSTRDTALCIEALSDYLAASGEARPDMAVETWLDGKRVGDPVTVTAENLFAVDNTVTLEGAALTGGKHRVELRRTGKGPVYFNAYLENFTLEDPITAAGLEVTVHRKLFKLVEADTVKQAGGSRGQAVNVRVDRFERHELKNGDTLKSGDLVEVELKLDSKNDYEYLMVEDMKAAGFEPVDVRSGYTGNELGAYMEFRDERVCLFLRTLARGANSVTYRVRAEIPGQFSVLPARISGMYAPELKGNSDEQKIEIDD